MKFISTSFALSIIVTSALIACTNESSDSGEVYFADVHISPYTDPASVQAFIVFNLLAENDISGELAHYTEHLVALNSIIDDIDSPDRHANAYAGFHTVGYHITGPKEDLHGIIKKLTGVFDPLKVKPDFARQEIDIVMREFDLRTINNVDRRSGALATAFLFKGYEKGTSVVSTPQIIKSLSYEQAKAYYAVSHLREQAVLLVQGDVSDQEVSAAIRASGLPPIEAVAINEVKPDQFELAEPDSKVFRFALASAEPRISYRKIVKLDEPVNYDLLDFQSRQLAATLETNLPGGFAGPLRYENFIARSFGVYIEPIDEQHIQFWLKATLDSGVSFEQIQSSVEAAIKTAGDGIPANTYDRVKMRTKQYWLDWEDEDAVTEWMQRHARKRVGDLRQPASVDSLKKLSKQVTLNDINVLLKALQKPGRQATVFIGNPSGASSGAGEGEGQ